jgi:hypothetical protein
MPEAPQIQTHWRARATALAPLAVAACGDVASAFAHRLLALDDESLAKLKGVAGPQLLIVLGDEELLVWVDGVTYLGRDEAAPSLLLPTTLEPDVPPALFERALLKRLNHAAPIAVLPVPHVVSSVNSARPISRQTLTAWLKSEQNQMILKGENPNQEGAKEHQG